MKLFKYIKEITRTFEDDDVIIESLMYNSKDKSLVIRTEIFTRDVTYIENERGDLVDVDYKEKLIQTNYETLIENVILLDTTSN